MTTVDPQPYNPQFQVNTGLTDWLNVLEFGAHNDGTAAAATVGAIQAANAIAATTGQLIYFPAGTYNLGGQTVTMTTGVQYLIMGTITNGSVTGGTLVNFGTSGITNPMTTAGDLIDGGTAGVPQRLPIGSAGQVLTVVSGAPAWATPTASFSNPMTTPGDLITGGTAGAAGRLALGSAGQILTVVSGAPAWANAPSGFANPMTTSGDLITGGAAGAAGRLAIGSAAQVLTVVGGVPAWANAASGFANPMTTSGDLITGGAAGAAGRLAIGSTGQVLTVSGGAPTWGNVPSGFANPMLAAGDMITAGAGGAPQRVAIGTAGQVLAVSNSGTVTWVSLANAEALTGPSSSQPTVFMMADGSVLVIPLSTYGLTGDDGFWINQAFTFLPQITGGGSKYGGSYNGPWIAGTIRLGPYSYILQTGILCPVNSGSTVNIIGSGPGTILFAQSGVVAITSHCAMGGPQAGAPAQQTMGCYRDFRIDGSAGAAAGIEIGGSWGRRILDVAAVNFMTPGAIGLHINNAPNAVAGEWTEKSRIRMDLMHCAQACVIENSNTLGNQASAADSAEYNDIDLYIIANNTTSPVCTGVTLQGGCFLSGGSLRIRGNFPGNSGPVLTIQGNDGSGPGATFSNIFHQFVDITVESNAAMNQPQTIVFGNNVKNKISNCTGLLSFQFANWVQSNAVAGQLQFGGVIDGDAQLQGVNTAPAGWA